MDHLAYRRHRFPLPIIQHAIWLYLRFTLSYRDVEELLAERGLEVSYETVRRGVLKFGPMSARRLRRCRPRPTDRWHLDESLLCPDPLAAGIAGSGDADRRKQHRGRPGDQSRNLSGSRSRRGGMSDRAVYRRSGRGGTLRGNAARPFDEACAG